MMERRKRLLALIATVVVMIYAILQLRLQSRLNNSIEESVDGAKTEQLTEDTGKSSTILSVASSSKHSNKSKDKEEEEDYETIQAMSLFSNSSQPLKKQAQMIIHIGPSKTGTTTIQKDCIQLSQEGLLQKDNIIYWGRYQKVTTFHDRSLLDLQVMFDGVCFREYEKVKWLHNVTHADETSSCVQKLKSMLDYLSSQNKTLVISDEAYSYVPMFDRNRGIYTRRNYFENLSHILEGWNVTVVVGYRRLSEWIVSAVKETHAKSAIYGFNKKDSRMKWPHEGGRELQTPWLLIDKWLFSSQWRRFSGPGITTPFYKYVDLSIPLWTSKGFSVAILNLHDSQKSITKTLLCDILDHNTARQTCARLHQRTENPVQNAKGMAWFAYNQILFHAAKRNLLQGMAIKNVTRIEATHRMQKYYEIELGKTYTDLPLICPPESKLELLLEKSIKMEASLLPEFANSTLGEEVHKATFQNNAYVLREYCWVDTEQLLKGANSWRDVLEVLKSNTISIKVSE